ncbi:MAG TPA: PSD1 and planctomycete cytochrome C domain-containing protein [Pirellulales bacterium]|nr:PSD1 and planctomycete cytochrome C domain-containing protein [Pirellulales bacterium]
MNLHCPRYFLRAIVVAAICLAANHLSAEVPQQVRFNRDVRPIMSDTCFKCHGPGTRKSGLRLDLPDEAMKPAESGTTPIVPGQPEKSEAVRRVFAADESEVMPPPEAHKSLTPEQKETFKRWVEQGAVYEKHWSFEPPVQSPAPQVDDRAINVRNPIDAFVIERLQRDGLSMSPEADRETLIRRVSFALTGLPPTLEELDRYLADASPAAYEKMVDCYLASPRFGEELARHWLDLARYADTHGLHLDNERQMWPYRDWVVRAFNQNMPFDQFTVEQLAGDLLPQMGHGQETGPNPQEIGPNAQEKGPNAQETGAKREQLVATGFIRCNVSTSEGGSIAEEWVFRNALDRTTTMAEAWMGLTAGCCVCHDHKFDPISTKEYYSLYAFFHSAADPPLDGNALLTAPTLKLASPADERKLADYDGQIAALQKQVDEKAAGIAYVDPASVEPRPAAEVVEQVWFDDDFPPGGRVFASPGQPTQYVTAADGRVMSGGRALKRVDQGLAQDVCEGVPPLEIPANGKLFAHVWIEAADPPKSLMLQYFKGGWLHRAVWGEYDAIQWGRAGTTERVHVGPLPEAGKWVRLEVEAKTVGLNTGDQVTGFAFTQFGGTVFWDKAGVAGQSDPASDPRRSLLAWWKQQTGKDTPGAPPEINQLVKAGPDKKPSPEQEKKIRDYYLQAVCADTKPQFEPLTKELASVKQARETFDKSIPSTFIFRDLPQPRESFVMLRGQYNKPGDKVEPGVPAVLPPLAKDDAARRANRLDLARWLVSPEHPLTARVAANRLWQQMFGVGLVKTSYDFGSQGELPSHPELLDWLAVWYRENGWDTKALLRLMVTSATFRQSSHVTSELWKRDPENRLYARGPRLRLDAEQLRDNALFVSGLLNPAMGGKGARPYQPPNIWEPVGFVGSNTSRYEQDHGAALYRRSLYTFFKRTAPPPFMANFDAPNRESFCTRRERTDTPLQALQLMNDVQHFEAARALAERILAEGSGTAAERIAYGYRLVLSRRPAADELAVVEDLLRKELTRYQQNAEAARQAVRNGESTPKAGLAEPELAAYTLVANLLLNLDETLTRN